MSMLSQNEYTIRHEFLDYHTGAMLADARQRQLLFDSGLLGKPWLSARLCRALTRLGSELIASGQRLEPRRALSRLGGQLIASGQRLEQSYGCAG
jgi:hypothetical protein